MHAQLGKEEKRTFFSWVIPPIIPLSGHVPRGKPETYDMNLLFLHVVLVPTVSSEAQWK